MEDNNFELTNKLLMLDDDVNGIWYFTTKKKCAEFLGVYPYYIDNYLKRGGKVSDTCRIEWVDGADVIYKYINPERK